LSYLSQLRIQTLLALGFLFAEPNDKKFIILLCQANLSTLLFLRD
jgi:hypothetical protein